MLLIFRVPRVRIPLSPPIRRLCESRILFSPTGLNETTKNRLISGVEFLFGASCAGRYGRQRTGGHRGKKYFCVFWRLFVAIKLSHEESGKTTKRGTYITGMAGSVVWGRGELMLPATRLGFPHSSSSPISAIFMSARSSPSFRGLFPCTGTEIRSIRPFFVKMWWLPFIRARRHPFLSRIRQKSLPETCFTLPPQSLPKRRRPGRCRIPRRGSP